METLTLYYAGSTTVSSLPRAGDTIACLFVPSPPAPSINTSITLRLNLQLSPSLSYLRSFNPFKQIQKLFASTMDMMPPSPPKSPFLSSSLEEVRKDGKFKCYKGVRKRAWGKWVSEIRVPRTGKRIWLGSYDAPEKAARAYDAALYCIRGERGVFNFPTDKKPQLPAGSSVQPLSRKDIQAIATSHASSHAPVSSHAATLTVTAQVPSHVPLQLPLPLPLPVPVSVPNDLPVLAESMRIPEMVSEAYVPANATEEPIFSVEDLQLDNFLMMDIDWINDLL